MNGSAGSGARYSVPGKRRTSARRDAKASVAAAIAPICASTAASIAPGVVNGWSSVTCAGTPRRADGSKRARSAPTHASASGTRTMRAETAAATGRRMRRDEAMRALAPAERMVVADEALVLADLVVQRARDRVVGGGEPIEARRAARGGDVGDALDQRARDALPAHRHLDEKILQIADVARPDARVKQVVGDADEAAVDAR